MANEPSTIDSDRYHLARVSQICIPIANFGLIRLVTLITLVLSIFMATANAASPGLRKLTIIGASYAADWGHPDLPGFVVTNKGIGGQESSEVRARFSTDVIADDPDAVLIWGHINDIFRTPRDQIEQAKLRARENYRDMYERATAAGIEVIFATEVTIPVGDSWLDEIRAFIGKLRNRPNYRVVVNDHVKDVNGWLRGYAAENNAILLDFERVVDSGNGSRRHDYTHEDGSHISASGYDALTHQARTVLARGQ